MNRCPSGKSLHPVSRVLFAAFLVLIPWAVSGGIALANGPEDGAPTAAEIESARKKQFAMEMFLGADKQAASQAEYDVLFYDLDLTMDHVAQVVSGTVSMRATPTGSAIDTVDINLLDNMTVSAVTMNGSPVAFSHFLDLITVTLDASYAVGDTFTVDVTYSGTPSASAGAFGFDTYSGKPMIWSLSEPYGARSWWPCKDLAADKPDSIDFRITVDTSLTVASNGLLRSTSVSGSQKTWYWHESYPIATYLVSVAIHPYVVFSDWYHYGPTDSMEIRNYAFANHLSTVQNESAPTADMITHFSDIYGQYPFVNEKYGHAEFLWGGAMEHQTMTSMGFWNESVVAHELAHQWFGDMITCNTFNHIWLNEGFATYSEALWDEFQYGRSTFKKTMKSTRYFGAGTVYVSDLTDWNRIFDSNLSYNKASWVLHMLRHVVGDSTFFNILQTYYADPAVQYGSATTAQFQSICESVSGMDLNAFFQQWIYGEYYPIYSYSWTPTPASGGYDVALTIEQKQTNQLFTMPIDVYFQFASGNTTLVVRDSLATQDFTLHVNSEPTDVRLDKALWILKAVERAIVNPTFDRGILVVNGVDWNVYGSEIYNAYADSVFWGNNPITFWDCFTAPSGGYPANLPAPLGTGGGVPSDTLKQFSTVVWVGNNYNGDLLYWVNTSILDYLEAGGNVVLLSRLGQDFIYSGLTDYLGITWNTPDNLILGDYTSTYTGLVSQTFTGTQSFADVFDTLFATGESEMLFKDTSIGTGTKGTGVWRRPAAGGTNRADGGRFVFLSGRPYRMDHTQLRSNMEYILSNMLNEPFDPTGTPESPAPKKVYALSQNQPNPFNPITSISFTIPAKERVSLNVYSPSGRLVKTLVNSVLDSGRHGVTWNGTDNRGRETSSGIYFYRLEAGEKRMTKKMVLLR